MMSAQVAIVADSALPEPPLAADFFVRLEAVANPPQDEPADAALFGDIFEEEGGNENTAKNFMVAMTAAHDFAGVLHAKGVELEKLDDWITAFSKWILDPECLFDDPEDIEKCKKQRQELCLLAGVKFRSWCPTTLKTAVNVLALKYRETAPPAAVVASSMRQLPNYNNLWNAASKRWRSLGPRHEIIPILEDHEVVQLYDSTNFGSWFEAQRMNLLILLFSIGQRTKNFWEMKVCHAHLDTDEDGKEILVVSFPNMKNLAAKQANDSKDSHKQIVHAHPNPKVCGVQAYKRQLSMIPDKSPNAHFFVSDACEGKIPPHA
jgi:hypothetical protein